MDAPKTSIAALGIKINNLSLSLGGVKKDGTNTNSGYSFISSEQMTGMLRDKLAEHNLSIIPSVVDYSEREIQGKKTATRTIVKMEFEIIDLGTGYTKTIPFVGGDQDYGGKSFGQAVTECTKRFYFKLFQVSSHEEVDPDSRTVAVETPSQRVVKAYGVEAEVQDNRQFDYDRRSIMSSSSVKHLKELHKDFEAIYKENKQEQWEVLLAAFTLRKKQVKEVMDEAK